MGRGGWKEAERGSYERGGCPRRVRGDFAPTFRDGLAFRTAPVAP